MSNTLSSQSDPRLAQIMFHKISAMHRYPKHQETLQASLSIQNLDSPVSFFSPQLYQPKEPSIPVKLQEVPPDLQDTQPCPSQLWNYDEFGFDTNGKRNSMVCTYEFFMSYRLWKTQTGERVTFWCTLIIFTRTGWQCFVPPVVVHQSTQFTQDIHYNILIDWVVQHLLPGYMDNYGWNKYMAHFSSMCCSSPLNPQVLFYDCRDIHFDDRTLNILRRHNIQYFILKASDSVHYQPNDNGPNMKLKNLYGNARINCMRHHLTIKFSPLHMNYALVETWEAFKILSATITQKAHRLPI